MTIATRPSPTGERGAATALILAIVAVTAVGIGIAITMQRLDNSLAVSEKSRARAAGLAAIESALATFTTLLDSQTLYVCGYNVKTGTPSNADQPSSSWESPVFCVAGREDKIQLTAGMTPGTDWNWDFNSQTFTHSSCYGRTITPSQLGALYDAGSGSVSALDSCTSYPATITVMDHDPDKTYFILQASVNVPTRTTPLAVATRIRILYPNSCNPNQTEVVSSIGEGFAGYGATYRKKPKKIKTASDWRKITHGGHYEVVADVTLGKSEVDWTNRKLKNVYLYGGKDKGHKIKIDDDTTVAPEDNVGVFSDLTCSTVNEVAVEPANTSPPPGKGRRPGKSCVGGIVGILRRGLVSNSSVTTGTDPNHRIKGVTGTGAVIGCFDNPAFWHSAVTASYVDAVVEAIAAGAPPDAVTIGGIVGLSHEGRVNDVNALGELIANASNPGDKLYAGGVVGLSDGKGVIEKARNGMNIHDDATGSVPSADSGVGGIVGAITGGTVANSLHAGSIDVKGANVGGIAGLVPDTALVSSSPPVSKVTIKECHTGASLQKEDLSEQWGGSCSGGDATGGIVGNMKGAPGMKHEIVDSVVEQPVSVASPMITTKNAGEKAGGLVGKIQDADVKNCFNASANVKNDADGHPLFGSITSGLNASNVFYLTNVTPTIAPVSTGDYTGLTLLDVAVDAPPLPTYVAPTFTRPPGTVPVLATCPNDQKPANKPGGKNAT